MKLQDRVAELAQQLGSALDRIVALESEVAELKENRVATKVAGKGRPNVFYRVIMVPKTNMQPQGKTLAKVLSEIPAEQLVDGLIPRDVALAAVEARFDAFKTVQTPKRMLNYYANELQKKNMLEIVEREQ